MESADISDNDIVSWVVEEVLVKDGVKAEKKLKSAHFQFKIVIVR